MSKCKHGKPINHDCGLCDLGTGRNAMVSADGALDIAFERGRGYERGLLHAAIKALPCYAARPGEDTYECQVHDGMPGCPACALRRLVEAKR